MRVQAIEEKIATARVNAEIGLGTHLAAQLSLSQNRAQRLDFASFQKPPEFRRSSPPRRRSGSEGPKRSDFRRKYVLARISGLACRARVAITKLPWMPRRQHVRSGMSCASLQHRTAALGPNTAWRGRPTFRRLSQRARRTRRSTGTSTPRSRAQSTGKRRTRLGATLLARGQPALNCAHLSLLQPLARRRVPAPSRGRAVAVARRSSRSGRGPNNGSRRLSLQPQARRGLQGRGQETRRSSGLMTRRSFILRNLNVTLLSELPYGRPFRVSSCRHTSLETRT
jgi:hypothetical protein